MQIKVGQIVQYYWHGKLMTGRVTEIVSGVPTIRDL